VVVAAVGCRLWKSLLLMSGAVVAAAAVGHQMWKGLLLRGGNCRPPVAEWSPVTLLKDVGIPEYRLLLLLVSTPAAGLCRGPVVDVNVVPDVIWKTTLQWATPCFAWAVAFGAEMRA
jgi:hypothetical protein